MMTKKIYSGKTLKYKVQSGRSIMVCPFFFKKTIPFTTIKW